MFYNAHILWPDIVIGTIYSMIPSLPKNTVPLI